MFIFESYLKIPHRVIKDLNEIEANPAAYFVDIHHNEEIQKIRKELDLVYLEGALIISYNKRKIMNYRHWDLIDQLWSYLISLAIEFLEVGEAESCFPDQPLKISLKTADPQKIEFHLGQEMILVPKDEFLRSLIKGGYDFFKTMNQHYPTSRIFIEGISEVSKLETAVNG